MFPGNLLVGRVGDVGFILLPGAREEEPWADAASTKLPARDRGGDRPPLPQQQGPSRFLFFFFCRKFSSQSHRDGIIPGEKEKTSNIPGKKRETKGVWGRGPHVTALNRKGKSSGWRKKVEESGPWTWTTGRGWHGARAPEPGPPSKYPAPAPGPGYDPTPTIHRPSRSPCPGWPSTRQTSELTAGKAEAQRSRARAQTPNRIPSPNCKQRDVPPERFPLLPGNPRLFRFSFWLLSP